MQRLPGPAADVNDDDVRADLAITWRLLKWTAVVGVVVVVSVLLWRLL